MLFAMSKSIDPSVSEKKKTLEPKKRRKKGLHFVSICGLYHHPHHHLLLLLLLRHEKNCLLR
jgi:hypothetical protein